LDKQVEVAKFLADVLRRLGDRRPIRNVKLKRNRARPNFLDPASTVTPFATSSFAT
jgi:hypothetical protein